MKYKFSLLFLLLAAILTANSVFSLFGTPWRYYGNDVYGMGMGESGGSDLFRINTNYFNPSLATTANKVIFSTATSLGFIWYKDKHSTYRDDGLYFPYFTFAIPLNQHKIAFSFNSSTSGNIENESEGIWEELAYNEINRLSSSIYKVDLLYALKNDIINAGIALNYYFGHRTRYWKMDFESSSLVDPKYELEKNFSQAGYSLGISKKHKNISWGLAYSSPVNLQGDIIFKYVHAPYADTLDTDTDYIYQLPAVASGGIVWRWQEKFKTALDFVYEFSSGLDNFDNDSYKLAAGFGYDPLSGYGQWWQQIPYRLGIYYRELPFESNLNPVTEFGVTAGISIPLRSPDQKIDLALGWSQRGNINDNDLQDQSLLLTLGVTGFDIFSKRQKKTAHRDIPMPD